MTGREPGCTGVLPQISQAPRPGVGDEQPKNAVAGGKLADPLPFRPVDAHRDELRKFPVGPENAERSIAGID
jgi:hypothetical protein